jgi:diguanylate cyclase (GGDEF)-like protein
VLRQRFPLLDDEALDDSQRDALSTALANGDSFEAQLSSDSDSSSAETRQVRVEPLYGRRGPVKYIMLSEHPILAGERGASSVDVGVLQREISRARQKAAGMDKVDPGTGLLCYQYFLEVAGRDFRMARRDRRCIAVLVLDIVELDVYGQTFGVKAAQSCLRMVAAQVNGALRRAGDLCARADDNRIVAVTQGQDVDEIRALGLRIAENVRGLGIHNPRARSGRYVCARIGVASGMPDGNYDLKDAIATAQDDLWAQESAPNVGLEVKAAGG